MSEPRKLNTGSAHTGQGASAASPQSGAAYGARTLGTPAPGYGAAPAAPGYTYRPAGQAGAAPAQPDAYEQARRSAQAAADQTTRLRRIQQGARPRINTKELTPAQRQAIAMRSARQQNAAPYAAPRTAQAQTAAAPQPAQPASAQPAQAEQPAQAPARAVRTVHRTAAPAQQPQAAAKAAHSAAPAKAAKAPAHGASKAAKADKAPAKAGKSKASAGKAPKGKKGKGGKKKMRWWQIALITILLIALILGGALALIWRAISPSGGGLTLDHMFNTPKEFQGKELNFLMVGIDRVEKSDWSSGDDDVGDGNTDMILYVHFNNETGEMKMLQIPRDYFVGSDRSVSYNYRLNNVAKTQGSGRDDDQKWNMAALCQQVSTMFQLPVDGYVAIHMEMLNELVDAFGYIELYIPQTISYDGSVLEKGYRLLNAQQVEFFLRNRKGQGYAQSDIDRLNMQRQFYSALFRRLKTMTVWEVAKVAPSVLQFMETDLNIGQLTSFAVSMLKIDSAKIMICQMPVFMGLGQYNGEAVVYPARQADADLLNQYFRENTGPVDASQLQLADNVVSTAGYSPTDPNIQYLKAINDQQADAAINDNPDGIYTVDYVDPDTTPTPDPNAGADSQPAAQEPAASQPAA